MERSTDVIQEALERFVGQFDSEELGLKFATKLCNSFCSEILPVINDNPEEATQLLGSTDSDFVDGLLRLISR
jgi:hypothetical protein